MALADHSTLPSSAPVAFKRLRGNSLIQAISKRLIRKSREDLKQEDAASTSSDSSSSDSVDRSSRSRRVKSSARNSELANTIRSVSSHHLSTSSVDVRSESGTMKNKRYYSTSADSIIKAFENLTTKSGNSNGKEKKKDKKSKKPPPKRILRSPVKYVYAKGWSGLPTQRIPVSRTYAGYPAGCRVQYIAGLNR